MAGSRIATLANREETLLFAKGFASLLKPNDLVALKGDLGAGKTTFVQGLLEGLMIKDLVQSPTFTYLQIYQGAFPIYHFDLYRLKKEEDFTQLGFEEFLDEQGVVLIEWPEKIASLLPSRRWQIELLHLPSEGRKIEVKELC